MIYADYDFYQEMFFGRAIDYDDFDRLAQRASSYMDYYTMGNVSKKPDLPAVKMCCCAIAEQYKLIEAYAANNADGKELKSQSVGAWSQTYESGTALETEARKRLAGIAQEYLAPTGLLYRGVNCHVSACCHDL